jgi:hypothetical protein
VAHDDEDDGDVCSRCTCALVKMQMLACALIEVRGQRDVKRAEEDKRVLQGLFIAF